MDTYLSMYFIGYNNQFIANRLVYRLGVFFLLKIFKMGLLIARNIL